MEELLVIGNPSRRRRRKSKGRRMSAKQRQYFGGGKRHRRRGRSGRAMRRYSIRGLVSSPIATLKPALVGAVGATAVNTILARVPLPAMLMTGRTRYLTQGVAAILLGTVASRFGGLGAATAAKMAEGSLTVTLHQALTDLAGGMGVNLSGMGYYLPGYGVAAGPAAGANAARMAGMSKYLTGPGSSVVPFRRMSGVGGMKNIGPSFGF
jgi:hypothetical protein